MDILVSDAYLCSMIARLVTVLALLAITVVTTASSAHAARMSRNSGPDCAIHAVAMMHSPDLHQPACEGKQHGGSAHEWICDFVCAGLSAFLISPVGQSGRALGPVTHDFPSEAGHVDHAPGLNERPPKLRLL